MRRYTLAIAVVTASLLSHRSDAAQTAVEQLQSFVGPVSYPRFDKFVTSHLDKIIGLKIAVSASENKMFSASTDKTMFVIYKLEDAEDEIVSTSDYSYQHGAYEFDGFFIVKSGGIHQGVVSYALESVSEAAVRLNPAVRIKPVLLGR